MLSSCSPPKPVYLAQLLVELDGHKVILLKKHALRHPVAFVVMLAAERQRLASEVMYLLTVEAVPDVRALRVMEIRVPAADRAFKKKQSQKNNYININKKWRN